MRKFIGIMVLGAALAGCDEDAGTPVDPGADAADATADAGDATDPSDAGTDATADAAADSVTDTAADTGPGADADAATPDATGEDAGDAGADDTTDPQDTAAPDDAGDATADTVAPQDFTIRVPVMHTITCDGFGGPEDMEVLDTDHVCTFEWQGTSAQVYVQATPTDCNTQGFPIPIFEVEGAFMKKDGVVTPLPDTTYDYGGGHNNDTIELLALGKKFKYFHSSFGWGWRKCQPMDCLVVFEPGGALIEDGCTKERTLPVVCVAVTEDGTVPELTDTFEPCAGDPNYE